MRAMSYSMRLNTRKCVVQVVIKEDSNKKSMLYLHSLTKVKQIQTHAFNYSDIQKELKDN